MIGTLKRRWWIIPIAVILIAAALLAIRVSTAGPPMPEALQALQSDATVQVSTSPWLVFRPLSGTVVTGLIFYPGGLVDARAYAPAAHAIADHGYLVVIVPMPLKLAVIAPERATDVMAAFPEIRHWAIGGHSLGGAMAATYAHRHPDAVQGLVLWGAYPAESDSLADRSLAVVSIYGTQDGLATEDKIAASRPLLPANTTWVPIDGGNHAQFGWYGPQSGDNPATISREAQQEQVVAATDALLARIGM